MKIGIIGHKGVIGEAAFYGFSKIGHDVKGYDIADKETSLFDVLDSEICFICVPTPSKQNWDCDTSIVESVVQDLIVNGYNGIIVIKSTVEPGTTEKLRKRWSYEKICFVPEFLRERCATTDFLENHDVCIIGVPKNVSTENLDTYMYNTIKKAHGNIPKKFVQVGTTEAELAKYFNNVHNAANIILANSFYEVCQRLGADYSEMKNAIVNREHIVDIYLDVNKMFRSFGGMCLPKDTKAMAALAANLKTNVKYFKHLIDENEKYQVTVFPGMRKE